MKVIITTGIYPPDIGGPATYIPQIASDLAEQGHQVSIITLGARDEFIVESGITIKKLKRSQFLFLRILKTISIIHKELIVNESVFSNGLFLETALALRFTRRRKLRQSVVKIVGDPVWERLRNQGKTDLSLTEFTLKELTGTSLILRKIYNWVWSIFNVRTSPSAELCNFVESNCSGISCLHIPNGVEITDLKNTVPKFELVTVSRLVNWKNIDIAIRVAAKLDLSLLIIGDGPELQNLQELAKELKAKAHFTGHLTSAETKNLMSKAKLFLQISDYEGLSFSLLEAMNFGLAPIVSNVPGNTEVISNMKTGLVVEINEESLEKAINTLLSDSDLLAEISRNAHEEASAKYDGKIQRNKVIELITKL